MQHNGEKENGGATVIDMSAVEGFTRRALLRSAGIGVGALALGNVVAACGSGSTASKAGGLGATLSTPFIGQDPTTQGLAPDAALNDFVYEALYRIDRHDPASVLEPAPELATEPPRKVGPTTYRITLREGVTFHDRSPFTADDIVFTIERFKDPATKSLLRQFFDIVKDVRAVGPLEVELELSSPTTLLAQRLTLVKALSKSAVAASRDALTLKQVGTGPCQVVSAVSGEAVTMKRFGDYSGPRELNYDDLDIGVVADPNARVSGLRTSQVKIVEDVPYSALGSLAQTDGVEAEGVSSDHRSYLLFNCGKPPFDDPRVRQAVLYAVDRDSITQSSYFGLAEPAWAGEVNPNDPDYAEPSIVYRYDPDRAKRLIADAGLGDEPIRIDFTTVTDIEDLASQAPIVEENLRAVGFAPDVIPLTYNGGRDRHSAGSYHLAQIKGDPSGVFIPSAHFFLTFVFAGAVAETLAHWSGLEARRLKRLLAEAEAAPDERMRKARLAEAQEVVQQQVPIATLHRKKQLTGWSDSLEGVRPLPGPGLPLDGVRG